MPIISAGWKPPDEYFEYAGYPGQGRWEIYGMELPDNVLEKVYNKNAEKVFAQFKGVKPVGSRKAMNFLHQVGIKPQHFAKSAGFSALLLLLGFGLAELAGCEKKGAPSANPETPASAVQASIIHVTAAPDAITSARPSPSLCFLPTGISKELSRPVEHPDTG